ncbi:hypothetical protein BN7_6571 [Wickerhamomyces ciferrii]|uniref:Arrestin-like N-terminal domain-containing protein n=1 Tax=Wickerhamomyces ciferrii (strain ATCC 14091 / BCRC 22168 / CBS 111 / JCM 3599 / NBRC 0793 / NRRL Y-1031 F-60-10) TaxID=1206466 RepID=K0L026_WICCF|nr:uncharacterized protein BN7_6571 [Wickerhamomyces ciferrii]CCH46964.1 hypothetical protein BN7_6571 [Wickerhamomyces ciferrii]
MGSGTADIILELNNTNDYKYKPLDVIRGRVSLKVHKEIRVKDITVKFAGISKSKVQVNEKRATNGNTKNRKVTKSESHTVAYDECTIFPPPNVRKVSNNKEFTLTPGEYVYDFAFKIPLVNICAYTAGTGERGIGHSNTILPPSTFIEGIADIDYEVRVTVRRASWLKLNLQEYQRTWVTNFDPIIEEIIPDKRPFVLKNSIVFSDKIHKRIALTEKPTGPKSYEIPVKESPHKTSSSFIKSLIGIKQSKPRFAQEYDVPFVLEVRFSSPILKIPEPPDLRVFLTSRYGPERYRGIDNETSGLGQFILNDFVIYLIGTYSVTAEGWTTQEEREYKLIHLRDVSIKLDLANLEPIPFYETRVDLNPFQLEVPISLSYMGLVPTFNPTFETCNIKLDYKLNIRAKFKEEKKSWLSKEVEFLTPVTVITGVPAPQEYIQIKQISPRLAKKVLKTYPPEAFRQPDDFTPLYDGTTAAPVSLNVEETETLQQDEKQKLTHDNYSKAQQPEESLPNYGSATKEKH